MIALVGEKGKKLKGKVTKEPPAIPCTLEELNHVLDKWIGDGVIKPFTLSRPPTEEERKNPLFCKIHNYVKHSTKDCWTLQRLFHKKLREGNLELTQREPEVSNDNLKWHRVVLSYEDGDIITLSFKLEFPCSNNTVEYEVYLTGLAIAFSMGIKHSRVLGDSNLVVSQVKGDFALRE
nr:hypothetical protein CFP56_23475 [Quercus suber]